MWRFAWQNLITRPTRTLLAVVGLTIPIVAILGLFSVTHGIRTLMGNTLAKMNGLMVMRANSPAPVFSDLPASMVEDLRKIPGTRIVAPEVWKICPPIEGRNLLARAATKLFTGKGADRFSSFAETIMIEGQQLPEHLHLEERRLRTRPPAPRERGRAIPPAGRRGQAQRADQHQDRPRLPQCRRHAQEGRRHDPDRRQAVRGHRHLRDGLALDRYDRRDGDHHGPAIAQRGQVERLGLLRRAGAAHRSQAS